MNNFLKFLKPSVDAFHAQDEIKKELIKSGYIELEENKKWKFQNGGKYFVVRDDAAIIAFTLPNNLESLDLEMSYNVVAAHLDSPTFKLKPNFDFEKSGYGMLNTEVYGGPILNSWFDRPLNINGRVIVKTPTGVKSVLVNLNKPMCIIPNCSIHYRPELNTGVKVNAQLDLVPLFKDRDSNVDLYSIIAKKYELKKENIISSDLYLSILDRGCIGGADDSFIIAPQIDNLECSYAILEAIKNSKPQDETVNVGAFFNSEEIGSDTINGAASDFLSSILERISLSLGYKIVEHKVLLANSFMISADNAQGFHPNYSNLYDPTNAVYLNGGIVIKSAARGSYTTNAMSMAIFMEICKRSKAKFQLNTNRSDVRGGSTLGAISLSQVSIPSVDIGLAQVAMHSSMETSGAYDLDELIKALKGFYKTNIKMVSSNEFKLI